MRAPLVAAEGHLLVAPASVGKVAVSHGASHGVGQGKLAMAASWHTSTLAWPTSLALIVRGAVISAPSR